MTNPPSALNIVCPSCSAVNRVLADKAGDGPRCGKCKSPLFPDGPVVLNEGNFDTQIARNDIPVVVDFWAAWCAPCRMMAPAFEEATRRMEPVARFAKLNTDESRETAARYGIRSIPTLMVFKGGREVARQPGAMPPDSLMRWISDALA
jgi:thioredoxin 2